MNPSTGLNRINANWDKPAGQWPRSADGQLAMYTHRLDLDALLKDSL